MADTLFYFFAALTLLSAAAVVFNKNAVNASLCLLLSLGGVAGLFALLDALLLAVLLILVYAGAVVALFLFIIMLLDTQGGNRAPFKIMTTVAATIGGGLLVVGVVGFFSHARALEAGVPPGEAAGVLTELKLYGAQLFTSYLLPVQVVGFLLLIAMLGVIVLSKRFEGLDDVK